MSDNKKALKAWNPAEYGVKNTRELLRGWQRILERIDEYERLIASRKWHQVRRIHGSGATSRKSPRICVQRAFASQGIR